MSPGEQNTAVRLLARWVALNETKAITSAELFAFATELDLLRIETVAFMGHERPAAAKASG